MKNEDKTKVELIKELKILQEERGKGVFKNVTKRKQTEQVIQESESRFRELFNHMSSGVAVYEAKDNGKDFIIKDFNRAAEKIEKVKKEDIIGKSILKVFPGIKDFSLFKVFQEVYKTGKPQHYPISLYKDQRITGWRENCVYKLFSGETVTVYDDITERMQAEERLLTIKNRLVDIMESITDGFVAFDTEMNYTFLNTQGAKLLGCKPADLLGKNYWTEFPETKGTPFANAYLCALKTRTPIAFEDYYEPWNRWFENRIYPTPEGIAIYFTETTQRKQAEEKIKHLNLVLRAIRNVNQLIVKEKDPNRLIKGVCENLVKTRGYHNTWIVLLDEEGKLKTSAEAGLGKDFLPMIELFTEVLLPRGDDHPIRT